MILKKLHLVYTVQLFRFCFDNDGAEPLCHYCHYKEAGINPAMVFLLKNMAATRSLVGILSSNNLKFLSSRTIQTSSIRAFSVCDSCIHSNGLYGKSILTKNKSNSGKIDGEESVLFRSTDVDVLIPPV